MSNHYFPINFFCAFKKSQRRRNSNFWQFNVETEMFVFGVSQSLKEIIFTIDAVNVE